MSTMLCDINLCRKKVTNIKAKNQFFLGTLFILLKYTKIEYQNKIKVPQYTRIKYHTPLQSNSTNFIICHHFEKKNRMNFLE